MNVLLYKKTRTSNDQYSEQKRSICSPANGDYVWQLDIKTCVNYVRGHVKTKQVNAFVIKRSVIAIRKYPHPPPKNKVLDLWGKKYYTRHMFFYFVAFLKIQRSARETPTGPWILMRCLKTNVYKTTARMGFVLLPVLLHKDLAGVLGGDPNGHLYWQLYTLYAIDIIFRGQLLCYSNVNGPQ